MDAAQRVFVRSSFCALGECVAVSALPDGNVAVRDAKAEDGPELSFTVEEWDAFVAGVKGGEFDTVRLQGMLLHM